jgi:hypothetical protein
MELDPPMKQSGSMASISPFRPTIEDCEHERFGRTRRFATIFGAAACSFFLASDATSAPFQSRTPRAVATPVLSDALKDRDGDGLDNALESGQASAVDRVDTDYDGWNDAEEIARGSLPTAPVSQPHDLPASIGVRAYMRGDKLHVATAVYVRAGTLANASIEVGVMSNGVATTLPASSYASTATLTTVPTKVPGELLLVTDIIVSKSPLYCTGAMSVYAVLQVEGASRSAAVVNLQMWGGVPMEVISPAQLAPNAADALGPGRLHRPLGGTQIPATWSGGQICFQRMEAVGTHGAVVTQEVATASCVDGWDGFCDAASCSSSVGTTVDTVDPAALIGG